MKIFIAHDAADEAVAAAAATALNAARHTVMRRSGELAPGRTVSEAVRNAIIKADFFVFIATAASTGKASTALSDLAFAHERWRDPKGRILAVAPEVDRVTLADDMLRPFPKAELGNDGGGIAKLVAEAYSPSRQRHWPLAAGAAVLVALAVLGGLYWLAGQRGGDVVVDANLTFEVPVDFTDTVAFGESRRFKLVKTAGPDIQYRCKVGPSSSSNISRIEHDETCSEIKITAADGPFVDEQGQPYSLGYIRPDRDFVPVVVESLSGKEIYRTSLQFRVNNSVTSFLLRGLKKAPVPEPGRYSNDFVVTPGNRYELQILTPNGQPLPSAFKCAISKRFPPDQQISVTQDCRLVLGSARPGSLAISISRENPGFSDNLLFDLVDATWQPPARTSYAQVTDQQVLDGIRNYRRWVEVQIEQREADRKRGVAFAQDRWYVEMLEQTLAEIDASIRRAEQKR